MTLQLYQPQVCLGLQTLVMVSAVGGVGLRPVELPNPKGRAPAASNSWQQP